MPSSGPDSMHLHAEAVRFDTKRAHRARLSRDDARGAHHPGPRRRGRVPRRQPRRAGSSTGRGRTTRSRPRPTAPTSPRSASARSAFSRAGARTARSSAGSTSPRSSAATSRTPTSATAGSRRFAGQGYMTEALGLVLREAFVTARSCTAWRPTSSRTTRPRSRWSNGSGSSSRECPPRYLKIGGRWRDHERYALRAETWRARANNVRAATVRGDAMSGVNGSRGSRGERQAGRGSAVPARHAPVHRRPAQPRGAVRRLRALRVRPRARSARSTPPRPRRRPAWSASTRPRTSNLEPFPTAGPPVDTPEEMRRPVLATDVVRFIGEPVAVVVADTRAHAVDAAELVDVDYEPLDVLVDMTKALDDDAPQLFPTAATSPRPARPARRRSRAPRCASARASSTSGSRPCRWSRARRWPRPTRTRAASSCGRRARARTPTRARSASRPGSRRTSCASSRPRPAAASARGSRATRSRSSSSRWRASSAAPCATSRRARRRCSRCSTAARRCRTSRSAARATARSPG